MYDLLIDNSLIRGGAIWVHFAALLYVMGYATRDQLLLRSLLLLGTVCYTLYYWFAPPTPLWDALFWSVTMGVVNSFQISRMLMDRTTFRLGPDEMKLFRAFSTMNPGEFRRVLKLAKWHSVEDAPLRMTTQGAENSTLYYLFDGRLSISRDGSEIELSRPVFIGELSFILGERASASVDAAVGSRVVIWEQEDLRKLEKRYPSIRIALREALNLDIAAKLAKTRAQA